MVFWKLGWLLKSGGRWVYIVIKSITDASLQRDFDSDSLSATRKASTICKGQENAACDFFLDIMVADIGW